MIDGYVHEQQCEMKKIFETSLNFFASIPEEECGACFYQMENRITIDSDVFKMNQ